MPEYIARDPRTGLPIRKATARSGRNLGTLTPPLGRWAVIPLDKIIPLAKSDLAAAEIPLGDGGGFATRFEYLRPPFPLRLLLSATLLAHGRRRVIAAGACTVEIHTRTGTVGNNR